MKKVSSTLLSSVILSLSLSSTVTHAQGGGKNFESFDSDSDGSVTVEEFTENFTIPSETKDGKSPNPTRLFERLDADGDGLLSAEEYDARKSGGGKGNK